MKSEKEIVRIRFKDISGGRKSIYLDIYINGVRRYEFLRLYLLAGETRAEKERNRETMRLANAVKSKRIVEIQNGRFGFEANNDNTTLFNAFERMIKEEEKNNSISTVKIWKGAFKHIKAFERRKNLKLIEITPTWLTAFKTHLKHYKNEITGRYLSRNTQNTYYTKLISVLNRAERDGIIAKNPAKAVQSIGMEESERMWLTIDEVRQLSKTSCINEDIKRAFLFSCLTGLRRSDIMQIKWADVDDREDGTMLIFRQRKTNNLEYMYISEQGRRLMGMRAGQNDSVFRLPTVTRTNNILKRWAQTAGINKCITFHCARHTFATMMLTLGNDLYTTSKLLGHRSITTTQIYARIIDEKKKDAINKIPDII